MKSSYRDLCFVIICNKGSVVISSIALHPLCRNFCSIIQLVIEESNRIAKRQSKGIKTRERLQSQRYSIRSVLFNVKQSVTLSKSVLLEVNKAIRQIILNCIKLSIECLFSKFLN